MNSALTTRPSEPALTPEHAYDLAAPFYDGWPWQSFWRQHEFPLIKLALERLRRGRNRGLALLDVGCGTGWYLENLAGFCSEQVGVDLSDGMLAVARHRLPRAMLLRKDARVLPFPDRRFDAILCTRVLSHLRDPATAIDDMRRVISVGGLLILSDVDADHDYEVTRLPVGLGHVRADTFKHPRRDLFEAVERLGFVKDVAYTINLDGGVDEVRRRDRNRPASPVAGWIGAWRRATSITKAG